MYWGNERPPSARMPRTWRSHPRRGSLNPIYPQHPRQRRIGVSLIGLECADAKNHSRRYPRQAGPSTTARVLRLRPGLADLHRDEAPCGAPEKVAAKAAVIASFSRTAARAASACGTSSTISPCGAATGPPSFEQSRVDRRQRQHGGVAVTVRIPVNLMHAPALATRPGCGRCARKPG